MEIHDREGDDFLVPTDVDLSEQCNSNSDILVYNSILPLGGCLSVICYIYIMWMYYVVKSPVLMRHPTTLAIYKCILDLFFVQQFLWLPFVRTRNFYDDDLGGGNNDGMETYYCNSSWEAALLAFCTQFFLLGSELCFLIISVDLRMAYTNPFTSFEANKWYFAIFVFLSSGITGLALIAMGPRVYGLASEGVVWVQDRRSNQSPNYPKVLLLYGHMFVIYLYCMWANFQYDRSVEKGLGKTVSNRISIMERSKRYTFAYIAYNTVTLALEFLSFLDFDNSSVLNSLPAYFYSCRGIGALLIILYSNKHDITWENMNPFNIRQRTSDDEQNIVLEGLLLQPHLNIALRVEMLYFTTLGIMHAARDVDMETDHASRRMTEVGPDESRCYSFDEGQASLRPSLIDEYGKGYFSKRPSTGGAELTTTALQGHNAAAVNGTVPASNSLAGLEKLQELQNRAVTLAVEAALLDQAETRRFQLASVAGSGTVHLPTEMRASGARTSLPSGSQARASDPTLPPRPSASGLNSLIAQNDVSGYSSGARQTSSVDVEGGDVSPMHGPPTIHLCRETYISDAMDTTDVEFSIRREGDVVNAEGDVPHWHRVDEPKLSTDAGGTAQDIPRSVHHASKSTTTDMLRTMLQQALANATVAAKNVFTAAHKDFRFKDFCPKLFAAVRAMHNITAAEYAQSFETTCRERFSEGRSGAFMFYSSDQRCIVKTTTKEESDTLNSIMPMYVQFLESNPNSLLVRFLGSHCITMYGVEIYFVVMLNFFPNAILSERYDLKGSWVNRHGMNGKPRTYTERMRSQQLQLAPLYQDNDLQHKIALDPFVAKAMADQIQRDILFLRDLNRMDYSLLIGVKRERFEVMGHKGSDIESRDVSLATDNGYQGLASLPPAVQRNWYLSSLADRADPFRREPDGGVRAKVVEGPGVYYFGIIDILQAWNWSKRLERFFKVHLRFKDGNGLSAIDSRSYADRFYRRCVVDAFDGVDEAEVLGTWMHASTGLGGNIMASVDTTGTSMLIGDVQALRQVRPLKPKNS